MVGPLFGAAGPLGRRLAGHLRDQPGRRPASSPPPPSARRGPITSRQPPTGVARAGSSTTHRDSARRRLPAAGRARALAALVFVQPAALMQRPDLGPAVHPVRRRRPLADADRPGRDRSPPSCSCVRLPDRPAGRWSTCVAGWRQHARGRPARARCCWPSRSAASSSPSRRPTPRSQVFSRPGLLVPPRRRARGRRASCVHLRRADAPLVPARRPRRTPGLGLAGGQLLRRSGADRGAHRHPALRPHHRLPRLPAVAALVLVRFLVALPVGAVSAAT